MSLIPLLVEDIDKKHLKVLLECLNSLENDYYEGSLFNIDYKSQKGKLAVFSNNINDDQWTDIAFIQGYISGYICRDYGYKEINKVKIISIKKNNKGYYPYDITLDDGRVLHNITFFKDCEELAKVHKYYANVVDVSYEIQRETNLKVHEAQLELEKYKLNIEDLVNPKKELVEDKF